MTSTPPTCQVFQQENVTISSLRAQIEQLPRYVGVTQIRANSWEYREANFTDLPHEDDLISRDDVLALLDATETRP